MKSHVNEMLDFILNPTPVFWIKQSRISWLISPISDSGGRLLLPLLLEIQRFTKWLVTSSSSRMEWIWLCQMIQYLSALCVCASGLLDKKKSQSCFQIIFLGLFKGLYLDAIAWRVGWKKGEKSERGRHAAKCHSLESNRPTAEGLSLRSVQPGELPGLPELLVFYTQL